MDKKRMFMFLLMCAGIAGFASADEVISIDINNYGNDAAYVGQAAVPGATQWIAYFGGWGIPAGSPRSSGLAKVGTIKVSTYAAQVWLADAGGHNYVTGAGNGLLDDGFIKNTVVDPNLLFIGVQNFGDAGQGFAYGGVFDVYVYGNSAGTFKLTDSNSLSPVVYAEGSVTGTVTPGVFELGKNYVKFENISIASPNSVMLRYSNELNGIQLVKKDSPKAIIRHTATTDPNDYTINAPDYDKAVDTNARDGENTRYGPDINQDEVFYLDTNESMEYDIVIDAANEGRYNLFVVLTGSASATLDLYLDGVLRGTVTGTGTTAGPVAMNLFEGTHIVKWRSTGNHGGNVDDLVFNYVGPVAFANCQEVISYGLAPAGDITGDCRVSLADLLLMVDDWTLCYDPVNCD